MADDADNDARPVPEKDPKTGRFVSGNIGSNGRPKGSRNKLGEAFLADMLADWEKFGPEAIRETRENKPEAYLKVIASILPRDLNVNMNSTDEMTDDELIKRLRQLDDAIRPFLVAEGEGEAGGGTETPVAH